MSTSLIQYPAPSSALPTPIRYLVSLVKRRIFGRSGECWNYQNSTGHWKRLKSSVGQAQLASCAGLLRRHAHLGSVLEIGCGEAALVQHLHPNSYASWLGVDISDVAIARAQDFSNERVDFVRGDMNKLDLVGTFDAIVFSGSIGHAADPAALLQRYANHLKPGGVFVISILERKRWTLAWRKIHSVAEPIDSSVTKNDHGAWISEVLRMKAGHEVPAESIPLGQLRPIAESGPPE